MARTGEGGGLRARVVKRVPVKAGAPNLNKVSEAGAAQLGAHLGDHVTDRSRMLSNPAARLVTGKAPDVAQGNDLARNVGRGGPGTGRTIYRAGTQAKTPPAVPLPRGRDTLGEFGPDVPGRRR
jgi:hypothetical protein